MSGKKGEGRGRAASRRPAPQLNVASENTENRQTSQATGKNEVPTVAMAVAALAEPPPPEQFEDASSKPIENQTLGKPIPRPKMNGKFVYCSLGEEKTNFKTNHFEMLIDLSADVPEIYRYDVEIVNRSRPQARVNMAFKRKVMDKAWCEAQRYFGVPSRPPSAKRHNNAAYGYGYDGDKLLLTWMPLDLAKLQGGVDGVQLDDTIYGIQVKSQTGYHRLADLGLEDAQNGTRDVTDIIAALDIIVLTKAKASYKTNGRSSFYYPPPPNACNILEGGFREFWSGCFSSVRPGEHTVTLNFDVSATVILSGATFLDLYSGFENNIRAINGFLNVQEEQKSDFLQPSALGRLLLCAQIRRYQRDFLRQFQGKLQLSASTGLKNYIDIFVEYGRAPDNGRPRQFQEISPKTALSHSFADDNGTVKTVMQYYHDKNHYDIQYPNLPLVQIQNRSQSRDAQDNLKEFYIPMELCAIVPGQVVAVKKGSDEQAQLVKYLSKMKPCERYRKTIRDMNEKLATPELTDSLLDFGITITREPMSVEHARVLPPVIVQPRAGTFYQPQKDIGKWAIIDTPGRMFPKEKRNEWVRQFTNALDRRGIGHISAPEQFEKSGRPVMANNSTELGGLYARFKQEGYALVICFVDKRGNKMSGRDVYAHVKQFADRDYCIPTQCVDVSKGERVIMTSAYLDNLVLGVNDKLGGINFIVARETFTRQNLEPLLFKEPVLLLGADVTHPGRGELTKPSIAAVVGNIDGLGTKYVASITAQSRTRARQDRNRTQEWISDLYGSVKAILNRYKNELKGHLPKRIIMFRDGVSEGQFRQVLVEELAQIQRACEEFYNGVNLPKITYIVICKRVHTKFFYEVVKGVKRHEDDRIENVPPGTIVEGDITQPKRFFEWYMVPHNSPLGTAKPTRYVVLHDDSNFTPDQLEYLSFSLCHAFPRCNKAVSLPAPVYHAHLAADRANSHLAARPFQLPLNEQDLETLRNGHMAAAREAITINVDKCIPNYWT